jgi:hypothetical protein
LQSTEGSTPLDSGDSSKSKRKGGRPRGRTDPTIDWPAIEKLFVFGEPPTKDAILLGAKPESFHFPSWRALATKFGVHHSLIQQRAKRYNWRELRERYQSDHAAEFSKQVAHARACEAEELSAILDTWMRRFGEAVSKGGVRADALADFNVAVRLRAFLRGEAEGKTEVKQVLSIEGLQERHADRRKLAQAAEDLGAGALDTEGHAVEALPVRAAPAEEELNAADSGEVLAELAAVLDGPDRLTAAVESEALDAEAAVEAAEGGEALDPDEPGDPDPFAL